MNNPPEDQVGAARIHKAVSKIMDCLHDIVDSLAIDPAVQVERRYQKALTVLTSMRQSVAATINTAKNLPKDWDTSRTESHSMTVRLGREKLTQIEFDVTALYFAKVVVVSVLKLSSDAFKDLADQFIDLAESIGPEMLDEGKGLAIQATELQHADVTPRPEHRTEPAEPSKFFENLPKTISNILNESFALSTLTDAQRTELNNILSKLKRQVNKCEELANTWLRRSAVARNRQNEELALKAEMLARHYQQAAETVTQCLNHLQALMPSWDTLQEAEPG